MAVTGVARLFAPNGFSNSISFTAGARLSMYVGTGLALGPGDTNAQADFATNLIVYGLPTVTNAIIDTRAFTGIVYAPAADVGVNVVAEIAGSIAAKRVHITGTCKIHYDEQISRWFPPLHPRITTPKFAVGAGLQFDVLGVSALNYVVETSTNLTDWTASSTNASPFTYTDPGALLLPSRFYRAVWAP